MKIIGSDYDGTLNHNGIDDAKRKTIEKWRAAGNVFAIVSGRGVEDMVKIYAEKKFGCDYFVADSGAVIMTPDGTVISEVRCDGSIAKPLITKLFEIGCDSAFVHTEFPCSIFADEEDVKEKCGIPFEDMPEIPWFTQISTFLPDLESADRVTATIRELFGDKVNPMQNGTCIDIVRNDMNKAKGLYILAEHLGAKYEDIIAVGDNTNDRDMIAEFRSYAMENGNDLIKELADYIISDVTELIEKELE